MKIKNRSLTEHQNTGNAMEEDGCQTSSKTQYSEKKKQKHIISKNNPNTPKERWAKDTHKNT